MHYIGLDLAWGPVNRTGIAVVDGEGQLKVLQTRVSDDEIIAVIAPYLGGDVLVGIDAPLLVTNDSGCRPAERDLGRPFRSFQAGPYPAFKNHPSGMFDPPRGFTLARELGLDIDPRSTAAQRAIEVYPHPATVALFRLKCTLKYKAGRGNTPAERFVDRKLQMLELIDHVTKLAEASPSLRVCDNETWPELCLLVKDATRSSQLDWVEDQLDAVLCAYIAVFFTHRRDETTTFGDFPSNGYIVTPTLPDGLTSDCSRSPGGLTGSIDEVGTVDKAVPRPPGGAAVGGVTRDSLCPCGCGQTANKMDRFLPGHDAKALHRRIAQQWGNTLGFVRWFDETYGFKSE